jgi:hypothetical protein
MITSGFFALNAFERSLGQRKSFGQEHSKKSDLRLLLPVLSELHDSWDTSQDKTKIPNPHQIHFKRAELFGQFRTIFK